MKRIPLFLALLASPSHAEECAPALSLVPAAGGVVELSLSAPCAPGSRVVLRHEGLAVSAELDAAGRLEMQLPVLGRRFAVLLPDGRRVTAMSDAADLSAQDRIVIQWQGRDDFRFYPAEGTVIGDPDGDWPLLAIYRDLGPGDPVPSIEAPVTPETCGRDLLAETLYLRSGVLTVEDLTLSMPDCEAVGGLVSIEGLFAPPAVN